MAEKTTINKWPKWPIEESKDLNSINNEENKGALQVLNTLIFMAVLLSFQVSLILISLNIAYKSEIMQGLETNILKNLNIKN